MTPREIIAEAWALTSREPLLKRWGFAAAFFSTLLNIKLVGYQIYFAYAYYNDLHVGLLDDFIWLHKVVPLWLFWTIVILFLLLLAVEFIFPNLAQGAIIGLTAKSHRKEKVEGGTVLALYNFFSILAIHEALILASWSTTLTLCSLTLRYGSTSFKWVGFGFILFFFVLSNILKFFFSFAEPAVVIRKAGVFEAMGTSFKMVVSYLGRIMFLFLLLVMISVRVLINTIVVLLIPAIFMGLIFVLTLVFSKTVTYIIATLVGLGLVVAASWLFAYLHVFNDAVWTIAYMELKKNKDLDHIE
jgi:hypothetical protein